MIEVFILTDVKWFELQLQGFFLHLVVFVTKTSICFPCDPKPTCSCLSIAFHAHFGGVIRVHRELRLSCSLWQDWARIWEGFFVLLSLLTFSELPKEARDISCFLLPLAQTGLPLLMKWLFPMSRHQTGSIQPITKFWRNLARWGCPQTTAGKRCQVQPCPTDLQA